LELATLIGPAKAVEVSESRAAPETIKILFISIGRFPFKARFACDIAEFLLYFPLNKCATNSRIRLTAVAALLSTPKCCR
jgi:hypothetical protein